jgi:hypothetical protein
MPPRNCWIRQHQKILVRNAHQVWVSKGSSSTRNSLPSWKCQLTRLFAKKMLHQNDNIHGKSPNLCQFHKLQKIVLQIQDLCSSLTLQLINESISAESAAPQK